MPHLIVGVRMPSMELRGEKLGNWHVAAIDLERHDQDDPFTIGRKSHGPNEPHLAIPVIEGYGKKKAVDSAKAVFSTALISGKHWACQ